MQSPIKRGKVFTSISGLLPLDITFEALGRCENDIATDIAKHVIGKGNYWRLYREARKGKDFLDNRSIKFYGCSFGHVDNINKVFEAVGLKCKAYPLPGFHIGSIEIKSL